MIDKKLKEISLVRLAVLFAILFLMVSQLLAQELNNDKLENLGVYRFDARGVSEVISLAITDRIRFEIQNRGQYSVIERDKMNLILKEQAFQQSGACLEASCLVEVGKLLAVTKMLVAADAIDVDIDVDIDVNPDYYEEPGTDEELEPEEG